MVSFKQYHDEKLYFHILYIINRARLEKGIEPEYKENDIKRRDMLRKVRAGALRSGCTKCRKPTT